MTQMKSPDQILTEAHAYVRKINDGKLDPIAVTAYIEGYTAAWQDRPLQGDSIVTIQAPVSDGSPSESSFDEFWNLYDKKVGRDKCIRLWRKLTAKEKRDCIAYAPLYVQAQPDKQYRKNPETFLRNKSFYDEIIPRNTAESDRAHRFQQAARVIASYDCED